MLCVLLLLFFAFGTTDDSITPAVSITFGFVVAIF